MKNKIKNYRNSGFTLIELLIVVLIIGVLTAAAVPSFRQAIARARYNKLLPVAKSVKTAEEAYYLANTKYTGEMSELDISLADAQEENDFFFFGGDMKLSLNVDSTHENVRLAIDGLNNRYVSYFDKSPNFPGETHCEALSSDEKAKSLCEIIGGTEHGSTGSYTTYLLTGAGLGTLTDAPARLVSTGGECKSSYVYSGDTCSRTEYDDGSYRETVSGSSWFDNKSCTYNSSGQKVLCTSDYNDGQGGYSSPEVVEYDPETGNVIKRVEYNSDGSIYSVREYDPETGKILYESRQYGSAEYTYNEDGKLTGKYEYNSSGNIDRFTEYTYDSETGKQTSEVRYNKDGSVSSYTLYDPETGRTTESASYRTNGDVSSLTQYDSETGHKVLDMDFNSDGELGSWSTYDPETGRETEEVYVVGSYGVWWHDTYDPETGESSSVWYDWNTQEVESASGTDENGNYYSVYYDSEGNITSYYDGDNSYYADGSMKSAYTYTSEDNENGYNYREDSYSYNQDGSYSHSWSEDYYNYETEEGGYSSGTNYYDSEGNFTGAYDGSNSYYYENGQLSSVYDEYNYSEYTFNSDGSLSSVHNNDYEYHIEFNSDGSVNYANSYGEWGDNSTSAIDSVVSNYQSNWGTASDYPSYDSWDTSSSTVTQDSWGTVDTSSWPSQDSWPSVGGWETPNTSDAISELNKPDNYEYSSSESTSSVKDNYKEYSNFCSDYSGEYPCNK